MTVERANGIGRSNVLHTAILEVVYISVQYWASKVQREYRLPNGRIADIYCEFMGKRIIIEVKTTLKQSLVETTLSKYWNQCDYLIIAAPPEQFKNINDEQGLAWTSDRVLKIGHLWVTPDGLLLAKPPEDLQSTKSR